MRSSWRATVLGALAVAVVALGGVTPIQMRAQEGTSADALAVEEMTDVTVDGLRVLGLSTDGAWLFGWSPDEGKVCSLTADAPDAEPTCAPFLGSVQEERIAFSPDGTRVAFTENSPVYLEDSDLWVFDLADGTLTNLTDDAYDGGLTSSATESEAVPVDSNPTWSPDGQRSPSPAACTAAAPRTTRP